MKMIFYMSALFHFVDTTCRPTIWAHHNRKTSDERHQVAMTLKIKGRHLDMNRHQKSTSVLIFLFVLMVVRNVLILCMNIVFDIVFDIMFEYCVLILCLILCFNIAF